ncbi:PepSY domain-containing protein [Tistrella arctica]
MTLSRLLARVAAPAAVLVALAAPALADPTCTTAARDAWIPEDQMKAKIAELGFKDIRSFEVTKGNCYEIYGHDKDGRKAEVYFDPTDARIVKQEID